MATSLARECSFKTCTSSMANSTLCQFSCLAVIDDWEHDDVGDIVANMQMVEVEWEELIRVFYGSSVSYSLTLTLVSGFNFGTVTIFFLGGGGTSGD